ncbi:hypothetical protein [Bacillus sp. FJAT-29937]|uniref:hypothetical protein n=1 Tax=Bacillus sp. FJAT-29937 TaxID=1720553 RepID=UPI00082F5CCA|nr:hypothetical protein [Bacillus sp. FJAT-29937]
MGHKESLELYQSLIKELTAAFPEGSVENTETPSRASIPVQAYIQRLEEVAGNLWSWKTTGDPIIYEKEEQIQIKGVLKILDAEREGIGFSNFQRYADSGKIMNLKHSILSAESDALRKACDKFRMGWVDLAPYRKWGSNPGIGIEVNNTKTGTQSNSVKCVKCDRTLTIDEMNFLKNNNIKINFCKNDIPEQLLKNRRNK